MVPYVTHHSIGHVVDGGAGKVKSVTVPKACGILSLCGRSWVSVWGGSGWRQHMAGRHHCGSFCILSREVEPQSTEVAREPCLVVFRTEERLLCIQRRGYKCLAVSRERCWRGGGERPPRTAPAPGSGFDLFVCRPQWSAGQGLSEGPLLCLREVPRQHCGEATWRRTMASSSLKTLSPGQWLD